MVATKILPLHWKTIVEKIHERECVPFLGAGVNVKTAGYQGLPLGNEVALRLLEEMLGLKAGHLADEELLHLIKFQTLEKYRERLREAQDKIIKVMQDAAPPLTPELFEEALKAILPDDENDTTLAHIITNSNLEDYKDFTRVALQDLARVSLRYQWQTKEIGEFVDRLKKIIPDLDRKPSKLLKAVAELPLELIVTTNYDRLMERALELLIPQKLKDADALLAELKRADARPLMQYLRDNLSDELWKQVEAHAPEQPVPPALGSAVLEELNLLIQDRSLYHLEDEELLKEGLTDEVLAEIEQMPRSHLLVRRNRELLEKSFPHIFAPRQPYQVVVQPIKGCKGQDTNQRRDALADHDGLILYKLHGTFLDGKVDEWSRPVITEEDYIEFLTYIGGQGEGIDRQITAKIQYSTLLFLGYSLEDWNFRTLFKGLIEKLNPTEQPLSFAIQKDPSEFWVRFWDRKGVVIYNLDLYDFAAELQERYKQYAQNQQAAQTPIPRERGRIRRGRD